MFSKLFNDTRPQTFFSLLILGVVVLSSLFFLDFEKHIFEVKIYDFQFGISQVWVKILFGALTLINAFLLNKKLTDTFEILRRNFFAAWFYLWLSVILFLFTQNLTIQIVNFFFIIFLTHHFRFGQVQEHKVLVFDVGLLMALLFVITPAAIWLLIPLYVSFFIYGIVNWRHFFLPILGFGMVQIIGFVVLFWIEQQLWLGNQFQNLLVKFDTFQWPVFSEGMWVFLATTAIYLLLAIPEIFSTINRANIYKRQAFSISLVYILATLGIALMYSKDFWIISGMVIPLICLFFANLVQYTKNKYIQVLLFLGLPVVFIFGIVLQFIGESW